VRRSSSYALAAMDRGLAAAATAMGIAAQGEVDPSDLVLTRMAQDERDVQVSSRHPLCWLAVVPLCLSATASKGAWKGRMCWRKVSPQRRRRLCTGCDGPRPCSGGNGNGSDTAGWVTASDPGADTHMTSDERDVHGCAQAASVCRALRKLHVHWWLGREAVRFCEGELQSSGMVWPMHIACMRRLAPYELIGHASTVALPVLCHRCFLSSFALGQAREACESAILLDSVRCCCCCCCCVLHLPQLAGVL
jgi:hypothetical protein